MPSRRGGAGGVPSRRGRGGARGRGSGGTRGGRGGGTPGRNNRGNTIAKRNSNAGGNNQSAQLAKKRLLQAKKTLQMAIRVCLSTSFKLRLFFLIKYCLPMTFKCLALQCIIQEATKITVNTPIHTNTANRLDGSRRTNQNRTPNRSRNNGNDGFSTRLVFLSFIIVGLIK